MKFNLIRIQNTTDFCLGRLYVSDLTLDANSSSSNAGNLYLCDTIEPPVRDANKRVAGKTAVPAGVYMLIVTPSPRFRRALPLLIGVPNMNGVRIHRGNTVKDTAGCILPGQYVGDGRLISSSQREQDILRILEASKDDNYIEIVNAFVSTPGKALPLSLATHVHSDASAPDLGSASPLPSARGIVARTGRRSSALPPVPTTPTAHIDLQATSPRNPHAAKRTTIADLIPFELRLRLETQIF